MDKNLALYCSYETVVIPEDVHNFVFLLDVSKFPGIGQKTIEPLKLMGISKVEELENCDFHMLTKRLEKMDLWMNQVANVLDFGEVK